MTSFHNVAAIVNDVGDVQNEYKGQYSSISHKQNVKVAETPRFSLNLFSKGVLVPRSLVCCRENVGVLEVFHHGGRLRQKLAARPAMSRDQSRDHENYTSLSFGLEISLLRASN